MIHRLKHVYLLAYRASILIRITNASFVFNHVQHAKTQIIVQHVSLICGFTKQHALQFVLALTITAQTEDVFHANLHVMIVTHCQAVKIVSLAIFQIIGV